MTSDQDNQPYVYLFGAREFEQREQPTSDIARFLNGEPVELTPQLAEKLLREFRAQDRYRMFLIAAIHQGQKGIVAMFGENVAGLEHPPTSIPEAVVQGQKLGAYSALGRASAAISDALALVAAEFE